MIALSPRRSYEDAVAAVRAGAIDLVLKAPDSVAYLKDRVLEAAGRSVGMREVDAVLDDIRSVHEEFLQRFVDAEKRALDLSDRVAGREPGGGADLEELRVLVVDEVDELYDTLKEAVPTGFAFTHATSGGEALDRVSSGRFHYAMVAEDLHDLPTSMVVRSMKSQNEELVVLTFRGPAENGRVELVESIGQRDDHRAVQGRGPAAGAHGRASPRRSGPRAASAATCRTSASATTTSCAATSRSSARSTAR